MEIREASRLQFYSQVKTGYEMEKYLEYDNRKLRRSYTRYRISDHNLRIEKDRWVNPKQAKTNQASHKNSEYATGAQTNKSNMKHTYMLYSHVKPTNTGGTNTGSTANTKQK